MPSASHADSRFLFLYETDTSLKESGLSGYRDLYASVVNIAADKGAKSVALKFFLFDAVPESDPQLEGAMERIPVLLQYALVGTNEAVELPKLPDNSTFASKIRNNENYLASNYPDLPLERFLTGSAALGFVDVVEPFKKDWIPLVGLYKGQTAKSLALLILEQQYGASSLVGDTVSIAGRVLSLDEKGRVFCDIDDLGEFESSEITTAESLKQEMTKRTVLIGYLGESAPRISTGWFSSMSVHELFFARLACLEKMIQ